MRRVAFCIVLLACGARASLDDVSVSDASTDVVDASAEASIVIDGHADEVGIAVGEDWICVYRPTGNSRCTGTFGTTDDATAIKLPEHMWNVRGETRAYGQYACGMTPNGLTCWGNAYALPPTCEKVPTLVSYIPSQSCQPTIVAAKDFVQVIPPDFVDSNGASFGFANGGSLVALPQPKPLRAVAYSFVSVGIDFDAHVVTWDDSVCNNDCTVTTLDVGLFPVGITSNRQAVCVWDVTGQLSCWGNVEMVGGLTPHLITGLPPVRDVIARGSSMCAVGQDGSVTCFGCTAPCSDYTQGYWWGDYDEPPLTTSPQTLAFPRPAIALAWSHRTCAVLDDLTVWCIGSFVNDFDGGTSDVPAHITALDP